MAPTYSFKVTKNIIAQKGDQRPRHATHRRWEQSRTALALGLALICFAAASLIVMLKIVSP